MMNFKGRLETNYYLFEILKLSYEEYVKVIRIKKLI